MARHCFTLNFERMENPSIPLRGGPNGFLEGRENDA